MKLGEEKVSSFYKKHTAQPELSTSKEQRQAREDEGSGGTRIPERLQLALEY